MELHRLRDEFPTREEAGLKQLLSFAETVGAKSMSTEQFIEIVFRNFISSGISGTFLMLLHPSN